MTIIDLTKQQEVDAHPKAMQEINCTLNLEKDGNTVMFLIIEKARETIFNFSEKTTKVNF